MCPQVQVHWMQQHDIIHSGYKNHCRLHHPVQIFFTYEILIMEPAQTLKINFLVPKQINNIVAAVNEEKGDFSWH